MTDMMDYKGYVGSVHYSAADEVFHDNLEGITRLITYEGTNVRSLKRAFHDAVEDYLESCAGKGEVLQTPFKGSFNVRVGRDLHKRADSFASEHGKKLNTVGSEALDLYLEK